MANETTTNTNIIFKAELKGIEIYVERFEIGNKIKYQGLYASGEAITELESNSNYVLRETMKELTKLVDHNEYLKNK